MQLEDVLDNGFPNTLLTLLVSVGCIGFIGMLIANGGRLVRQRPHGTISQAYAQYFNDITDAILVIDSRGKIIDANPMAERLFGRDATTPLPLVGRSVESVLPSLPPTGASKEARVEFSVTLDGILRQYSGRVSDLLSSSGDSEGKIIVLRDITTIHETERQLAAQVNALRETNEQLEILRQRAQEADRLKSEFLSTMSHELRTPLHVVLGYTELMLDVYDDPLAEHQLAALQRVRHSGRQLLMLINGILELARLEAGELTLTHEPLSLSDWMEKVVAEIRPLATEKGLILAHMLDARLPVHVMGDSTRLRQIASHLLSNAVKFTQQGHVRLEVRQASPYTWVVEVNDTGIGIKEQQQSDLFGLFRQGDGSHSRRYGGTGLGLRMVRRLTLLMGGQISVSSTHGVGSTFTVLLPLLVPEEVPAAPSTLPMGNI
jgi:PAS domain S-box-containing protein